MVLVEAQSTWNPNMALRMLFCISETYRRYLIDTQQSEHSTSKVNLPKPEFYVIYTGEQEKPEEISFSEEFFGGNSDIELKIKVLSKVDATLAGQYVGFCRVFDEQRKLYENSIEAAIETYRICIEKGYLEEFMKSHEKEVIDMMAQLFDEEVMRRQYDIASRRKEREEGRLEGILEGKLEGKMENMLSTAQALIKLGSMSLENISMVTGLPLSKVQELSEMNS